MVRRKEKCERGIWCDYGSAEHRAHGQGHKGLSQHRASPTIYDQILVDHGCDLRFHERTHLLHERQFLGIQGLDDLIEVAARRRNHTTLLSFVVATAGPAQFSEVKCRDLLHAGRAGYRSCFATLHLSLQAVAKMPLLLGIARQAVAKNTGVSYLINELGPKRLGLLRDLMEPAAPKPRLQYLDRRGTTVACRPR